MFWYWYGVVMLIAHTPLVIDVLRMACPRWKLSRIGYWSRYILLVSAPVVGLTALWQLLFVFLPLYEPDPFHTVSGVLHLVFILWIAINITVNYYRALLTHPGVDKSSADGETDRRSDATNTCSNGTKQKNGVSETRSRTGDQFVFEQSEDKIKSRAVNLEKITPSNGMQWRPNRGNYCKICKYRVAYMDHHCPYVGTCFGINNYSYFYIGMCYGLMAGLYAFTLSLPYFWKCDVKYLLSYLRIVDNITLETDVCDLIGTQSRAFIVVVFALWLVGMMFIAQNILLLGDVSTQNALRNAARVPLLSFIGQRIRGRKYLHLDSRLNILLLSQRRRWFHYLVPVGNTLSNSPSIVVHAV